MKELNKLEETIIYEVSSYMKDTYNTNIRTFVELEDGTTADITGTASYDSYEEDDFRCGYGNGTGYCVTSASVSLSVKAYDANEKEIEVDEYAIERTIEEEFNK